MFLKPARTAAAAAIAACAAMAAPAHAADLPLPSAAAIDAYDAQAGNADGWRHRHRRDRDRGIDAGDVIAGVVVLGAIAAIASAASRNRDERRSYPDDVRNRPRDDDYESSGLARAVDMCVAEIERGRERVRTVHDAARDASGWRVSGELEGGEGFTCRIGNDGRIGDVEIGYQDGYDTIAYGDDANYEDEDRQYSDDVYARVRAGQRATIAGDAYEDEPRPAYPGGPLPGEEGYGAGEADDHDGRYDTLR